MKWQKRILNILVSAFIAFPVYPHSKMINEENIRAGDSALKSVHYQTSDTPGQVINFYKDSLTASKMGIIFEDKLSNAITFSDNKDRYLTLNCQVREGITHIYVVHSLPKVQAGLFGKQKDALSWIKPYPGSETLLSTEAMGSTQAGFKIASNCYDCIVEHYKSQMISGGWKMEQDRTADKNILNAPSFSGLDDETRQGMAAAMQNMRVLFFSKGEDSCSLTFSSMGSSIITMINYNKKQEGPGNA